MAEKRAVKRPETEAMMKAERAERTAMKAEKAESGKNGDES